MDSSNVIEDLFESIILTINEDKLYNTLILKKLDVGKYRL
jgi:hypothetical protein